MIKITIKAIYSVLIPILFLLNSFACTNVPITAEDGSIVIARSLEFGPSLESQIISSPRGREFQTATTDGHPAMSWKSKYGYILVDYFNSGNTLDGMNEKGLSFGYLYLPGYTKYQSIPKGQNKNAVPYTVFGDWVLGNFSNVDEVKDALNKIVVFEFPLMIHGKKVVFPLHAIVSDVNGRSIVIEFIDGKMRIYDSPTGVMTNSPPYDWQLNNLKNYANLSPYSPKPIRIDGYVYSGTGQGSGLVGLPGDPTPPSRFVRITMLQQTALPVKTSIDALNLAQHVMNEVDIPNGFSRGERGSPNIPSNLDKTQWVVFKDLKNGLFYFRSYGNPTIQSINMNKIDFSPGAKQLQMPLAESKQIIPDATQKLIGA